MQSPQVVNEILNRTTEFAKKQFGDNVSVILFGSYARGDSDFESDIDIMIVADKPKEVLQEYRNIFIHFASELDIEYGVFVSLLLRDRRTFQTHKTSAPFYRNIVAEGINFNETRI